MTIWRMACIVCIGLFCSLCEPSLAGEKKLLVGMIRWAGWFKNNHHEKYLADKSWRHRLPYFAKVTGEEVTINEEVQKVMDQEILYASRAGIHYWTFNYRAWPRNTKPGFKWGRQKMYKLHLASRHRDKVKFCLMLQDSLLGPSREKHAKLAKAFDYRKEWDVTTDDFVNLFRKKTYQKVLGNRPLVYVFGASAFKYFESREQMKEGFQSLGRKSRKAGLGKPYLVAMTWLGSQSGKWFDEVGYDALTGYSAPIHPRIDRKKSVGHPYSKLAEANRTYWEACRKTGRQVIPIVNEGWDARPHFVKLNKHYDRPKRAWFRRGTVEEVAGNVRTACEWVKQNPKCTETRSVLLYAWNEFAEGGWFCPTLKEGSKRLDAVGKVLAGY